MPIARGDASISRFFQGLSKISKMLLTCLNSFELDTEFKHRLKYQMFTKKTFHKSGLCHKMSFSYHQVFLTKSEENIICACGYISTSILCEGVKINPGYYPFTRWSEANTQLSVTSLHYKGKRTGAAHSFLYFLLIISIYSLLYQQRNLISLSSFLSFCFCPQYVFIKRSSWVVKATYRTTTRVDVI